MQSEWVYEPYLSDYEALIFYNALKKHTDSFYYKPIAIGKREETGMKYRYLCISSSKDNPYTHTHFTVIEIYKPQMALPYVTCLFRIEFDKMFPPCMPYL